MKNYKKHTLCYLENGSRSVNLVWQCQVWYLIRWPWLIVGILHAFSQLYYTLKDNNCCLKGIFFFFFFKWRASLPGTEAVLDVHTSAVGKTKLPIALLPDCTLVSHCFTALACLRYRSTVKTVTGSSFMQTTGFKSATLTHSSCIKFTIISINTCSVTFMFFMSREVSKLTEREFAMKQEKVGCARVRARQQQFPPPPPPPPPNHVGKCEIASHVDQLGTCMKVRSEFR